MRLPSSFRILVFLGFLSASLPALSAASFSTVVIDAGHGGHDRGGIPSNLMPEKGVALDVAQRVRNHLNKAGLRTVMTRDSDVFIPLGQRVSIGNAQKRAIFVSIHFNSGERVGANGIETFYHAASGKPLASIMLRNAMKTTSGENRDVKHANFYVLRNAKNPAVLIECGFLTNPGDVKRASSRTYREQLAVQIARAIVEYRNLH